MLTAQRLTLWRGYRCLFENLDLALAPGQLGRVRGSNGSGKTTLLRVLAGLTRAESGEVRWCGQAIERNRAGYAADLAYLGHSAGLKADLTVRQNLDFAASLRAGSPASLDAAIAALEIAEFEYLPVRYLSAGQRRRVALARVLGAAAKLWILDEPLANLDAAGQSAVAAALQEHLAAGGSAAVAVHGELQISGAECIDIQLGGQR